MADIEPYLAEEHKDLSPSEKAYFDRISNQLHNGDPTAVRAFLETDYIETPVPIDQFLDDPQFLGRSLVDEMTGRSFVYTYWREAMQVIFASNATEIIFTGPIGSGKSATVCVCMAYILHQLLCLRDPFSYYQLMRTGPIVFLFFSLSLKLSQSSLYQGFSNLLINSSWFKNKGMFTGRRIQTVEFYNRNITYSVGSPKSAGQGAVGQNIVSGALDEISEVGTAKEHEASAGQKLTSMSALKIYEKVARRIESRFEQGGRVPGKLFLVSSKQDEAAFLERYIEEVKGSPHVMIFDDPIWEIRPARYYPSGKTFALAVGDRFKESRVIGEEEDEDEVLEQGYDIIYPPVELLRAFQLDTEGSLRDYAGISASMTRRSKLIPRAEYLLQCVVEGLKHPFTGPVYLSEDDEVGIEDYFVWDDAFASSAYRFIHVDLALNGCAAGIAMCHRSRMKEVERITDDGTVTRLRDQVARFDFMLQIRNAVGANIPFWKVRRFILYLRRKGVRIGCVTFDGWQSVDCRQLLSHAGINSDLLSMDKNDIPYVTMRNAVYEARMECYEYAPFIDEAKDLEHNRVKKKVDHPQGEAFSKDVSDAVGGALFRCLEEGDQPAPEKSVEALRDIVKKDSDSSVDPMWWLKDM